MNNLETILCAAIWYKEQGDVNDMVRGRKF